MRVFLIHGMGRSRASMMPLAGRLKRAGHRTSSFGYYVSTRDLDTIRDRWVEHLEDTLAKDRAQSGAGEGGYAIIGHSLGNIITRYSTPALPPGLRRFVMLAPPNQTPRLARALRAHPVYRALTGDAGQRLGDPAFYESLESPEVPTLVFAGDAGGRGRFLPFGAGQSDGVVGVEETRLAREHLHRVVPALHTFIMNDREVTRMICHFLEKGTLEDG